MPTESSGVIEKLLVRNELLCLADTKWVLAHWYLKVLPNGRRLDDFTALSALLQEELGHTRALFRFLEEGHAGELEFDRTPQQIHSMELLDYPPQNWADFVLTALLAETATWELAKSLQNHLPTHLLGKMGEEEYFHQLALKGWSLSFNDRDREDLQQVFLPRVTAMKQWLVNNDSDPLEQAGLRYGTLDEGVLRILDYVHGLGREAGWDVPQLESENSLTGGSWDNARRRMTASFLPAKLWELMVPTNEFAVLARRPRPASDRDRLSSQTQGEVSN
ncbi:MAG: hypothetical protein C7B46_06815 [Sulfobacillus benefaciens]|uniref:Phenylacetic acid catabolic n=1 Tax=Sulfobacillus benefaciens TaxID=453960 RepID=A0A2T2XHW5_9FIRM|nr:MAG: hypothetical protein C7B46_06815 [Sulfobacillus benefaciens]